MIMLKNHNKFEFRKWLYFKTVKKKKYYKTRGMQHNFYINMPRYVLYKDKKNLYLDIFRNRVYSIYKKYMYLFLGDVLIKNYYFIYIKDWDDDFFYDKYLFFYRLLVFLILNNLHKNNYFYLRKCIRLLFVKFNVLGKQYDSKWEFEFLKKNDSEGMFLEEIKLKRIGKYIKNTDRFRRSRAKHANCYLHHSNSNYFITFTDLRGNVLSKISSGVICDNNSKKKKISPTLTSALMNRVIKKIKKEDITNINIYLLTGITFHVWHVITFLKRGKFFFGYVFDKPRIPHHFGQRKKKEKRL